jgi:hypothetical protein
MDPVSHKYMLAKGLSWRTARRHKAFSSEVKTHFNVLISSFESDIFNQRKLQNETSFN